MAHVKNAGGGLGDEDPRRPPRLPVDPKGRATKKLATRKRKYPDADTARAATVAEAAERAERGGAHSGVWITDQLSPEARATLERVERLHGGPAGTLMIGGQHHAFDEGQPQGESQQQAPPVEQTQEGQEGQQAEEIEQAPRPQLHSSGRTRAPVMPRADTQWRGFRPPPRPQGPPLVTHLDLRAATAK